jgi:anthranilate phosphoribosyltransferase
LNAGAALVVAGIAANLRDGVDAAITAIENGSAKQALEKLIEVSNAG